MPILTTNGPKPTSLPPGTLLGYIIIAVVSAILLGGLIYALSREPPPIVDSVGCLKDDPPPELIAIIIDRTDPLSSVQAATVINGLKTIKAGEDRQDDDDPLPRWTEFRAYTVGSVLEQTREMNFRACFPGRPEDVDITTESYRRAVAQWKKFNEKFEQYLGGITPSGSESESPLIESIRSVGATTFSDPQFNSDPKTRKRLIIVSDMLQNSALFSHYRVWLNCRTDVVGAIERCVEKNPKKGEECTMFGGRRSQTCET